MPSIVTFILVLAALATLCFVINEMVRHNKRHALVYLILAFGSFFIVLLVVADILDVNQHLTAGPNLFLLEKDGGVIAGFTADNVSTAPLDDLKSITNILGDETTVLQLMAEQDYYRTFTVKWETFDNLQTVSIGNLSIPKAFIDTAIHQNNTREYVLAGIAELDDDPVRQAYVIFPERIQTDQQMRGFLFQALFAEQQPDVVDLLRNDHATVFPETITFKLLLWMPEPILSIFMRE